MTTKMAYSYAGAAEQLSVSIDTIRRLVRAGEIRAKKREGGRVMIPGSELDAWLQRQPDY